MKVAIMGTGYVGLVTGTCLAEIGHEVICVDIDQAKVERLKKGDTPIYEPGLEDLLHKNQAAGRLSFTADLNEIGTPQVIFLALPTPPQSDGSADLSFILTAAAQVAKVLQSYTLLVTKSTVPVGTAEKVRSAVATLTDVPFDVVSNPEFLREGLAIEDFLHPDRIVVGTSSSKARDIMQELYQPLTHTGVSLLLMDEPSAELTKYAANSFLATKVSFINEIANLCELVGANVDDVRLGMGTDTRIGLRFLNPGLGYGGSCFPKDVLALEKTAAEHKYELKIVQSVIEANAYQKEHFIAKIAQYLGDDLSGKAIALWGLAFKPDTDDIRETPARPVIEAVRKAGGKTRAYDPEATQNARQAFGEDDIVYTKDAVEALEGADALVIVTDWQEFASIPLAVIAEKLQAKIVIDGRNMFKPDDMAQAGLRYISVGRKPTE